MKTLTFLTSIFLLAPAMAADYSKCKEFFSPSGLGNPSFSMDKDGKITPHPYVISYESDDKNKEEHISYVNDYNLAHSDLLKTTIKRDDKGDIIEITHANDYTQENLDRMKKTLRRYSPNSPFLAFSHSTIKLEIRNGECVPVKATAHNLIQPKVGGTTRPSSLYNTKLCKELDDFLKEHPEAEACFKDDLNDKVSKIFEPYKSYQAVYGMGGGMSPHGLFTGFFGRLDSLLVDDDFLNSNPSSRKFTGRSPVISAHIILEDCRSQGLEPFIKDENLWKKAAAKATPSTASPKVKAN